MESLTIVKTHISIVNMIASIKDNITDDEKKLNSLIIYSDIELECYKFAIIKGYTCYNDYSIDEVMLYLNSLDYNELNEVMNHLNINCQ